MSRIICFDTETTGLDDEDKVIQLSIAGVDSSGSAYDILNEYYSPGKELVERGWPEAERVTGIGPADVMDRPELSDPDVVSYVQGIFDAADLIIGYNVAYDIKMVQKSGIDLSGKMFNDPMKAFAPYYWCHRLFLNPDEKYVSKKGRVMDPWMTWAKGAFGEDGAWINRSLSCAALQLCGLEDFGAHDSMNDVYATVEVWNAMNIKQEEAYARMRNANQMSYDSSGTPCLIDEDGNPMIDPNGNAFLYVYDYTLEQMLYMAS